jgi:hypothetical protein
VKTQLLKENEAIQFRTTLIISIKIKEKSLLPGLGGSIHLCKLSLTMAKLLMI